MNRKQFIESFGATCRNWTWSWSFVNHEEKFVIFGAWDKHTTPERQHILGDDWVRNQDGIKNSAFPQSLEHVQLVESGGYRLFTFRMSVSDKLKDDQGSGPSKIERFERVLTQKRLRKIGKDWFAVDHIGDITIPEEVIEVSQYAEGAYKSITVNAYERSREARDACIAHYKAICAVCDVDLQKRYGDIAKGLIHVHHLVPLSEIKVAYKVDPIKDLRPVCPNCHAVIHYCGNVRSIEEVKEKMKKASEAA